MLHVFADFWIYQDPAEAGLPNWWQPELPTVLQKSVDDITDTTFISYTIYGDNISLYFYSMFHCSHVNPEMDQCIDVCENSVL